VAVAKGGGEQSAAFYGRTCVRSRACSRACNRQIVLAVAPATALTTFDIAAASAAAWLMLPGGASLAGTIISCSWDATIKVWDAAAEANTASIHCGVGNALYCLDWPGCSAGDDDAAAGGGGVAVRASWVGVGCRQRAVQLYDLEAGLRVLQCDGHLKEVGAVQLAGNTIVSGSGDTTIKVRRTTGTQATK